MAMAAQPVAANIRAGVGERPHVAVADDRDALDRLDHRADAVEVDRAAEALRARPAVDRDRRDADLLELAGEERGRSVLSSSQPSRILTVTGIGTASTTARTSSTVRPVVSHIIAEPPPPLVDLVDRAAHVDVDVLDADDSSQLRAASRRSSGSAP